MVDMQMLFAAYIVAAVLPLGFLPFILAGRDKAGARGLVPVVAASTLYSLGSTLGVGANADWHGFVGINLIILAASLGPVGYLLIAGEYTDTFELRPLTVGILAVEPVLTQFLAWTNDSHYLVYERGTDFSSFVSISGSTVGFFWIHTAVAYGVLISGCILFGRETLKSQGIRRKQSLALTVAAIPPGVTAGFSTFIEGSEINLTPFGLLVMVGILSWALLRGQFLDVVPVARRKAISEIDDAMVTLDRDERVIDANPAARQMFDIERDFVGLPATEFFGDLPTTVQEQIVDTADIDTQLSVTLDGERRHYSVSTSPVGDNAEKGRVLLFREITTQKRRELQLESYEALFEESSDCIVETEYVDDEPIIRSVNTAFEEVFGYDQADILGESLDDVIVPDRFQGEASNINEQERIENSVKREVTRLTTDGEREFLLRTVHYQDDLSYGVYTDITEQKEREQTLQRQNERLDRFASVISHDLRNPLNAAQLRFDLIRDEAPTEHATVVEQNLDRMEQMIDELLTLAQSGQTVESTDTVSLRETAMEAWEHVESDESSLNIDGDASIEADRDRLLHVFENLFRNALDHNDSPVTIRVGPLEETNTRTTTGFFIEDNGVGVDNETRADIFEHGYTTSDDGTGFGLSIVEDIVRAHDWSIQVTDSQTGGARFEITGVKRSEHKTWNSKESFR
jgi:PAS domain S-box-containing protein